MIKINDLHNEEIKAPVQTSPEQLVGFVGEGHFAIRDSCLKSCQNLNIQTYDREPKIANIVSI